TRWPRDWSSHVCSSDLVARAWLSALQRAQEWEFARLTVPPIGTGAGNLPVEAAADIMVSVLKRHLEGAAFPADVSFVVETEEDRSEERRVGEGGSGGVV